MPGVELTAIELIDLVNQVLFVGLFGVVLWHALRQPSRARIDTVLLFGSIALVVVVVRVMELTGSPDAGLGSGLVIGLLNIAPYAMLRLVDDFSGTQRWVQVVGAVALVAMIALSVLGLETRPVLVELATVAWFGTVGGYAAVAFAREAQRTRGITRRRMRAVALGAGLFIGAIVIAMISAIVGGSGSMLDAAVQLIALASVLAFFLGITPPTWVRRAWREPDLRQFLERSIHLTGVEDDRLAMHDLQQAVADTFGASGASIGIADTQRGILRYLSRTGEWTEYAPDRFIGGRAFVTQRRVVAMDAGSADPAEREIYERAGVRTIIAAPITVDERRLGVLTVYADRAPVFIEDDLWLLELMADQTGVLLEARSSAANASALRAREEAARLKEEFLSAAAHDLRTPLTVVLGQAELIERRLARNPEAAVDPIGIARMAREARHLRDLVSELLDAQRLDQGLAVMQVTPVDLREVMEGIRRRHADHGVPLSLEASPDALVVAADQPRLEQVVENLLENAYKYGVDDKPPRLRAWRDGDEARVAVVDHGAGIPDGERERIFERFYRAGNARDITDTGMGLGLYICRRIVEEHGGRIWAEETPGGGTTFVVALALVPDPAAAPGSDPAERSVIGPGIGEPAPYRGPEAVADA